MDEETWKLRFSILSDCREKIQFQKVRFFGKKNRLKLKTKAQQAKKPSKIFRSRKASCPPPSSFWEDFFPNKGEKRASSTVAAVLFYSDHCVQPRGSTNVNRNRLKEFFPPFPLCDERGKFESSCLGGVNNSHDFVYLKLRWYRREPV